MAQPLRASTSPSGDTGWLSTLVETLDRAEQLHDVPCDETAMRAIRAQLSRPTSTRQTLRADGRPLYSPASCNRGC